MMTRQIPRYSDDLHREFHVHATLYVMLLDRGYLVVGELKIEGSGPPRSGRKRGKGKRVRGARFDLVIFNPCGTPCLIVEVKRDGSAGVPKPIYSEFGIPVLLCAGVDSIPSTLATIENLCEPDLTRRADYL